MNGFEPEYTTEAIESAIGEMGRQLERELIGAWRAGYNYLHVYEPISKDPTRNLRERFTLTQYTFPSKARRRPSPPSLRYLYTYDIGSVPDGAIAEALERTRKDNR